MDDDVIHKCSWAVCQSPRARVGTLCNMHAAQEHMLSTELPRKLLINFARALQDEAKSLDYHMTLMPEARGTRQEEDRRTACVNEASRWRRLVEEALRGLKL